MSVHLTAFGRTDQCFSWLNMRSRRGAFYKGGHCCSTYLRVPIKFVTTAGEKQLFLKTKFIFNTKAMMQNAFYIPGALKHYSSQAIPEDSPLKCTDSHWNRRQWWRKQMIFRKLQKPQVRDVKFAQQIELEKSQLGHYICNTSCPWESKCCQQISEICKLHSSKSSAWSGVPEDRLKKKFTFNLFLHSKCGTLFVLSWKVAQIV